MLNATMDLVITPTLFGLFGFIEPCTVGSTLVFIKYLEGQDQFQKLKQVVSFALVRALFMGSLGVAAALLGQASQALQKPLWIGFGSFYIVLGVLYLSGKSRSLKVSIGPKISRLSGYRGSVLLGLLFGFNIPACATPLLLALMSDVTAKGAAGGTLLNGFISVSVFGMALSVPLVLATVFRSSRNFLSRIAELSGKIPRWTGTVLIILGIWSVWFGLFTNSS